MSLELLGCILILFPKEIRCSTVHVVKSFSIQSGFQFDNIGSVNPECLHVSEEYLTSILQFSSNMFGLTGS